MQVITSNSELQFALKSSNQIEFTGDKQGGQIIYNTAGYQSL